MMGPNSIKTIAGEGAIRFETVEPHLKYLRLITVNFRESELFDRVD